MLLTRLAHDGATDNIRDDIVNLLLDRVCQQALESSNALDGLFKVRQGCVHRLAGR